MLSGITVTQQLAIQRLQAGLPRTQKAKLLGQGGPQSTFADINSGRYANGTNPVWAAGVARDDGVADGDSENNADETSDLSNTEPEETISEEEAEKQIEDADEMKNESKSSRTSASAQGDDCEVQTAQTQDDAATSKSHKKDSIAKEKKVQADYRQLEKDQKNYEKNLELSQRQVQEIEKKVAESTARMEELQSLAESLQDSDEDFDQDKLKSITQEMAIISSNTKNQTIVLDSAIQAQNSAQKKALAGSKKMELSFAKMISVANEYQERNNNVQETATTVNKVSGVVKKVGKTVEVLGETLKDVGLAMQAAGGATSWFFGAGAALIAAGEFLSAEGNITKPIGKAVKIVGELGEIASDITLSVAKDSRTSIDSFMSTSSVSRSGGAKISDSLRKSSRDIKTMTNTNRNIKSQAQRFDAMIAKVSAMGGGGGAALARGSGGGGSSGLSDENFRQSDNIFADNTEEKNIFAA